MWGQAGQPSGGADRPDLVVRRACGPVVAGWSGGWRPRGEEAAEDPREDVPVAVLRVASCLRRAGLGWWCRREQLGQPGVAAGGEGVVQVGGVALLPVRAAGELVLDEQRGGRVEEGDGFELGCGAGGVGGERFQGMLEEDQAVGA
jgi:hypothetical protein